ncbi:hypothetical protein [Ezakiella peruensis]|uniref:hypothetical protein n=1 Tax=Ezakiella peruensis TaxID=1464038 RepID=UPI000C1B0E94|nr:hypothetical protein [Ezakiella peruensis]
MSDLKKIRVQHVGRDENGLEVKTDVDVLTDASAVTMDGKDLKSGIGGMIDDRIGKLIDGAPQELDTLKEIADELSKNQSGVTTILKKLGDKAGRTEIKTKLSEMTEDTNHRTVTDTEKTTWNNKVDKDGNKILSTNDFTDEYKELVDYSFQAIELGFDKDEPDKSIIINLENIEGRVFDSVRLNAASQDKIGLMSKEDKKKLDDIDPSKLVTNENLADFKRCKILTQSEYDALSSTEKNRADTLYFIKG